MNSTTNNTTNNITKIKKENQYMELTNIMVHKRQPKSRSYPMSMCSWDAVKKIYVYLD